MFLLFSSGSFSDTNWESDKNCKYIVYICEVTDKNAVKDGVV